MNSHLDIYLDYVHVKLETELLIFFRIFQTVTSIVMRLPQAPRIGGIAVGEKGRLDYNLHQTS